MCATGASSRTQTQLVTIGKHSCFPDVRTGKCQHALNLALPSRGCSLFPGHPHRPGRHPRCLVRSLLRLLLLLLLPNTLRPVCSGCRLLDGPLQSHRARLLPLRHHLGLHPPLLSLPRLPSAPFFLAAQWRGSGRDTRTGTIAQPLCSAVKPTTTSRPWYPVRCRIRLQRNQTSSIRNALAEMGSTKTIGA